MQVDDDLIYSRRAKDEKQDMMMVYYVSKRLLEYDLMSEDSSLGGESMSFRALKAFNSLGSGPGLDGISMLGRSSGMAFGAVPQLLRLSRFLFGRA